MTKEEAIDKVRAMKLSPGKDAELIIALHTLIPELRESEDERIRKEIISLVLKVMGQEKDNLSDDKYDAMLAWLEKQKESKKEFHIPSYMGMAHYNPVPIEQKEDKDELVYCLNGLMQDYIKEGKDDEEKKHRLKCYQLFWDALEDTNFFEQKEQKPNIELIQRSWYMEGYHDREFGKEPKWIIKTGEGGPKHELNPRYGQPLAEQRPTEEQLHNLNEAIKGLRMDGCERMADSLHSLYNILRTQEQKPSNLPAGFYYIDLNGNRYYSKEFRYGDMKLKVGEQKPVLTAKEAWKEMRLEVYAQASGNRHEPNYSDDSTKMFSLCDIDEIFEKIGNSTVEQKPTEWSEEDKLWLSEVYFAIDHSMYSETERQAMKKYIDYLRYQSQPKPVEWSEEDKEALDMCLDVIPKKWKTKSGILLTKWLKDNIHLQPKQEWSEEDERMLSRCEKSIESSKQFADSDTFKKAKDNEIDWLENRFKSLRPSWKPSEEQEEPEYYQHFDPDC